MEIETKKESNRDQLRLKKEFKDAIRKLKRLGVPEPMNYFLDKSEAFYLGETEIEGKYVGTTCIHVPVELIYALDMKPIRLCTGITAYNHNGAHYLPANTCPLVKSTAGFLLGDLLVRKIKPVLIVNTLACDQKKKLGTTLELDQENWLDMPLPGSKDKASQIYWKMAVEKLIARLEKVSGKKLKRKKLVVSIKQVAAAQTAFRRLHELRARTGNFWGSFAILVANNFFFDDIADWTQNVLKLTEYIEKNDLEDRESQMAKAPRILLTGSPSIFPNLSLPIMIEQMGALVAVDEFCSSNRLLYDMAAVDEWNLYDMVPALADKYMKPSTCPNFVPNEDRIRKIKTLSKSHRIDGVIYQVFQGCQLYDMESISVQKQLRDLNIPVLVVETDYGQDESGQLQTRLEAFLDSLQN